MAFYSDWYYSRKIYIFWIRNHIIDIFLYFGVQTLNMNYEKWKRQFQRFSTVFLTYFEVYHSSFGVCSGFGYVAKNRQLIAQLFSPSPFPHSASFTQHTCSAAFEPLMPQEIGQTKYFCIKSFLKMAIWIKIFKWNSNFLNNKQLNELNIQQSVAVVISAFCGCACCACDMWLPARSACVRCYFICIEWGALPSYLANMSSTRAHEIFSCFCFSFEEDEMAFYLYFFSIWNIHEIVYNSVRRLAKLPASGAIYS